MTHSLFIFSHFHRQLTAHNMGWVQNNNRIFDSLHSFSVYSDGAMQGCPCPHNPILSYVPPYIKSSWQNMRATCYISWLTYPRAISRLLMSFFIFHISTLRSADVSSPDILRIYCYLFTALCANWESKELVCGLCSLICLCRLFTCTARRSGNVTKIAVFNLSFSFVIVLPFLYSHSRSSF